MLTSRSYIGHFDVSINLVIFLPFLAFKKGCPLDTLQSYYLFISQYIYLHTSR